MILGISLTLGLTASLLGGVFLAKNSPEEMKPGKRYFYWLRIVMLCASAILPFINFSWTSIISSVIVAIMITWQNDFAYATLQSLLLFFAHWHVAVFACLIFANFAHIALQKKPKYLAVAQMCIAQVLLGICLSFVPM